MEHSKRSDVLVKLNNISYKYSDDADYSLKNITLEIKSGEFILLSGKSGCGKTSITKCINGLIPHFHPEGILEGNVAVNGIDVTNCEIHDLCPDVASVFQDPRSQFFTTKTTSEIAFGCENLGVERKDILERISRTAIELDINNLLDRSIFELSSGEKQKIAFASVYAMKPTIFVLDEPSANLDSKATELIKESLIHIKKAGHTVIIAEHRLYYLRDLIDRLIYLDNGKIAAEVSKEDIPNIALQQLNEKGLRCFDLNKIKINERQCKLNSRVNLKLSGITYAYKRGQNVLDNISFQANGGEIIGIVGNNGTGKTTLAKLICGLIKETSGTVTINNKVIKAKKRTESTYFVMQDVDFQLFTESVQTELQLGVKETDATEEEINHILNEIDLSVFKDRHPFSLSGGQKQRVVIGASIMSKSSIIVFDEPTSGLDYQSMMNVNTLIKEISNKGNISLIISHDYEFIAEICTRIICLQGNGIAEDFALKNNHDMGRLKRILSIQD